MNVHDKFQLERNIFTSLINFYKKSTDPHAVSLVIAYETGLQAIEELYEASQKTEEQEVFPF